MKYSTRALAFAGIMASTILVSPAMAANSTVESALKSRSDVSTFYQALVNTGVINELNSGVSYTVFAPTNEAMAEITQQKYPCFYSAQCKSEVADILRNHIVPSEVNMSSHNFPGAVFSIDKNYIALAEPSKNRYIAGGKNVISQNQLAGSVLYKIDGVIASPQELASVSQFKYIPVADATVDPTVTRQTTTERVYYSPEGRPDGLSQTTTVTKTYSAPPPLDVSPAR